MKKYKRWLMMALLCLCCIARVYANSEDNTTIVLTPHWTAQAQFAGYYVAEAKGFYRKAGVNVRIVHPTATLSAFDLLRSGKCQASTMALSQALENVDGGIQLVNILQTSMNSALVIVSARKKNPITQKGARVGVWVSGSRQIALCMSVKEHLNYRWVKLAQNINLFLTGALDAMVIKSFNEYYQLMQVGFNLKEKYLFRFSQHGYNIQEDGLYMTRQFYSKHTQLANKFAQASRQGWEWAAKHPEETLDIVMQYVNRDNIATNRIMQRFMLNEILKQQIDCQSGKREFRLRQDMVEMASQLMYSCKLLSRPISYNELVYNLQPLKH